MLLHLPLSNLRSDNYSLSRFQNRLVLGIISQQLNQ